MTISNYNLYPISKEASKWRDLDVKSQNTELALRISMIAGLGLLLITMAVSIYYCATTSSTFSYTNDLGERIVHVESNALCIMFPAVFGTFLCGVLIAGIKMLNFDECENGGERLFSRNFTDTQVIDSLTRKELRALHSLYYKKYGGLRPLVRRGFLHHEHADKLRVLLAKYHEARELIDAYSRQSHIQRALQANKEPPEYHGARMQMQELNDEWLKIRSEIQAHYDITFQSPPTQPVNLELLPECNLMKPTWKTRLWKDCEPKDRLWEIRVRTACVAGIILLTIGIIVGLYFSAITHHTEWYYNDSGAEITYSESNLIFGLPAAILVGLPCFAGLIAGFIACEAEASNGSSAFSYTPAEKYDRFLMLTEGSLNDVHVRYYKQNGGMGPLVRKGFLTIEQGERLSQLLKRYHINKKSLDAVPVSFQNDPAQSSAYQDLLQRKQQIEQEWRELQSQIKGNFRKGLPQEYLPDEMWQQVFSYLSIKDLGNVSQVNQRFRKVVGNELEARAQEYHVPKKYLASFLEKVEILAKEGHFPEACIVYRPSRLSKKIDVEATLKKLSRFEDQATLKRVLGEALVTFTKKGEIGIVQTLLILGASLEERDINGNTPLLIAAKKEMPIITRLLVEKGADVDALNIAGETPLYYANYEIASWLLTKKNHLINHAFSNGDTVLHRAARHNHSLLFQLLLKHGADPTIVNSSNQTPYQINPSFQ